MPLHSNEKFDSDRAARRPHPLNNAGSYNVQSFNYYVIGLYLHNYRVLLYTFVGVIRPEHSTEIWMWPSARQSRFPSEQKTFGTMVKRIWNEIVPNNFQNPNYLTRFPFFSSIFGTFPKNAQEKDLVTHCMTPLQKQTPHWILWWFLTSIVP